MSKEIIKADLHIHSQFSPDSLADPWQIRRQAYKQGLDTVALVDHNTLAEGMRIFESPLFIFGEEILTSVENPSRKKIEIVGLFLQEPISPGQALISTIEQIGAQDGIIVIPHPFELWRHGAGKEGTCYIISECQKQKVPVAIEVFNARAMLPKYNRLASELWQSYRETGVLATAGSDAHRIPEIGRAHVSLPPFATRDEFLESLTQAKIYGEVNALGTLYHRLLNRIELQLGQELSRAKLLIRPF